MTQMFQMRISGDGEVRRADGTLKSTTPVETTIEVPETHLRALGLTDAQINEIKGEQP